MSGGECSPFLVGLGMGAWSLFLRCLAASLRFSAVGLYPSELFLGEATSLRLYLVPCKEYKVEPVLP